MKTFLAVLIVGAGCCQGTMTKAQQREAQLAEEATRRTNEARVQFEALEPSAIETALENAEVWQSDPLRAGAALRVLAAKNDPRAVVRVLLSRLDGNTERKRSSRESTGVQTEWNAILHNLRPSGSRIAPFWLAELASRPIANPAAQQAELRLALQAMVGSESEKLGRAIDGYLATLPSGSEGLASANLCANLGFDALPTLRPLLPEAGASAQELSRALSSDGLWSANSDQAVAGLEALLKKDEPLAFAILVRRFDGWSQAASWVDPFERPNEPYSLERIVDGFDAPLTQRFLEWLAAQNLDQGLTVSQKVRLGRAVRVRFPSREGFNAALLAAAAKQPDAVEAQRRLRACLAAR